MMIRQIFISPGHNYFGHHGRPADEHPLNEVSTIECIAGRGIRDDRFYDHDKNYKGQVTFFSAEVFADLVRHFGITTKSAGVLRRNIIVSGINLHELIGREFVIQGVRFRGTSYCKPCYWLDQAFAPGTEEFLKENGGLRAQILSDGEISVGEATLSIVDGKTVSAVRAVP